MAAAVEAERIEREHLEEARSLEGSGPDDEHKEDEA